MSNPSDKSGGKAPPPGAPARPATPARAPGIPSVAPLVPPVAPVARPTSPGPLPRAAARPPTLAPQVPPVAAPRVAPGVPRSPPAIAPAIAPLVPPVAPVARPGAPLPGPTRPPAPAGARAPSRPAPTAQIPARTAPTPAAEVSGISADQRQDLEARTANLDALDYFEILRVPQEVSPAEIKKAFYRESRLYHPDRFFHLTDQALKSRVHDLYKRITEAYFVLRDDVKRPRYLADVNGPERARKLRFSEASEVETKQATRKEQEEQIGTTPKGRQFYQTGVADLEAGRNAAAERNLKMALTYEPTNARYKEKLAEAQQRLKAEAQPGDPFKIR